MTRREAPSSPETKETRLTASEAEAGERLDRFVSRQPDAPTRSQIKQAISRGEILLNGEKTKPGAALRAGDQVAIRWAPPPASTLVPQPIPLEILHEDQELIVLSKAPGMVVHPAPGHPDKTLVNALLAHCGDDFLKIGAAGRPGIVHRLDKDTSGVLVVAKTKKAHAALSERFSTHDINRAYLALCHGPGLPDEGSFETLHARHPKDRKRFTSKATKGKRALTHFKVLERFAEGACLVRCRLETGRTHQIRVHLSEHHAPILGDPIYGGRAASKSPLIHRVALHATLLAFRHPGTMEELHFEQPPPADFAAALEALRAGRRWR